MKKRFWLSIICLLSIIAGVQGQEVSPSFVRFRAEFEVQDKARIQRIQEYVTANNTTYQISIGNGESAFLYDIINGKPVYVASYNAVAADNTNISELRLGGDLGLSLAGKGLRLLVWEAPGGPRPSHVEFEDRLILGSDHVPADAASPHASHVTGTVMAAGINPEARGMANEATGVVYDFNNDVAEMTDEMANNVGTMILSNHSYGAVAGWNDGTWLGDIDISTVEDWRFGFYNNQARQYDALVYNSPHYMIVKAAGNDRNDVGDGSFPADGPFDVITFSGTAKNIITVGAVQKLNGEYTGPDDVQISNFSSFGPTDDGRIKPDIVAPGVSVRSTGAASDDDYLNLQGTSMASPVVMGGLALIQELSKNINNRFLKAAELKALMIHTAKEAGRADGPDYKHGWGLLDASSMGKFMLEENNDNKDIIVASIADGETKSYTITPVQDSKVKLTIVWTDVPGTPVATQLDPEDLMLVNDLDMRAIGASESQMPWFLQPNVPEQGAQKGDNFRDNVEKIEFVAMDDSYEVRISHKNAITEGPQEFALIVEYEKSSAAQTFYWVGNSGNWSDGANWSTSSGGMPANTTPSSVDKVIFDANAFPDLADSESFIVTLSQDVEVSEIKWFNQDNGSLVFDNNEMSVSGDLIVLSDNIDFGTGVIRLSGQSETGIVRLGSSFADAGFVLDRPAGSSLELAGDVFAHSIAVLSGELMVSGINLEVDQLTLSGGGLTAENAVLSISEFFRLESESSTISWMDSKMIALESAAESEFNFGNSGVLIDLEIRGSAVIQASGGLNKLTVDKNVRGLGDLAVNSLTMSSGSSYLIEDGRELTVNEEFDMNGDTGSLVKFASTGTSQILINGRRKICVEFLEIEGVNYSGSATLSIGVNSTVNNESGWNEVLCDDLLFADFDFQYACENSFVFFEGINSGSVQDWMWTFDDQTSSTEQNLMKFYPAIGTFDLSLTVGDGTLSDTFDSEIVIGENDLAENSINVNGNTLISRRGSSTYLWFKDGAIVQGATGQTLDTQGEGGTYRVVTFSETCNRISESFDLIITGIEEERVEQEKLNEALTIFPNPSNGFVDVKIEGYDLRSLSISLVGPEGKVVSRLEQDKINSQSFTQRLNISDKSQGFYILRFIVNENIYVSRKVILVD